MRPSLCKVERRKNVSEPHTSTPISKALDDPSWRQVDYGVHHAYIIMVKEWNMGNDLVFPAG